MGSWLAIYIWLMSNKYKHQIQVFFYSSPLLAKYFPSPNTSPLFLLQSLSRIWIKDQFADLSGPFGLVYHENIEVSQLWPFSPAAVVARRDLPWEEEGPASGDHMSSSLRQTRTITFVFLFLFIFVFIFLQSYGILSQTDTDYHICICIGIWIGNELWRSLEARIQKVFVKCYWYIPTKFMIRTLNLGWGLMEGKCSLLIIETQWWGEI